MEYTSKGKMIMYFDDDSKTILHGELVFNGWGTLEQFITDDNIIFTVVESTELFENIHYSKIVFDEDSVTKIRRKNPTLYKKIEEYVDKEFYLALIDKALKYVRKEHPEFETEEFEEAADEVLEELKEEYKEFDVVDKINYVPMDVKIIELEDENK